MTDETKQALTTLIECLGRIKEHAQGGVERNARNRQWGRCMVYQGRAEAYEDAASIIEQALATGTTEVPHG